MAARELCGLISELAHNINEHVRGCIADTNLTAPQAIALRELSEPLTMRELADRMHCATSNVTFVVDRLEKNGLVTRQPHPRDRRAKQLALTAEGERQRAQIIERFSVNTPLAGLTQAEQQALHGLLQRALADR
ncbi:MarR family winged helix-turn-helix transcriptional regulator [Saccharopolyspora spinosa]|uniref:DNA-binding MarR family transcriptional regulator n=2 Tax=Saccharopolyspora spinosa TaxID=60894 RepID=A0A2N3XT37_SACSN|nr:MarR family transcriptional regulator [Saccharopolyspora spinosa]PKW13802.1 DNA-binding MarR family transcriptional regulator [Saccharopolyspora spinosa]